MEELRLEDLKMAIDTVWVLVTGFLVFWMHAGFACLEAGMTRAKNTVNILMKNVVTVCIGGIAFFLMGYALMFGEGTPFVGTKGFLLSGVEYEGLPPYAFWFFQMVFCATAATIVSGAVAERIKFFSYFVFAFVITAVIYPVSGHWIWGGGWLSKLGENGFHDFAGSTVVHSVGGWAALAGCIVLGARIGKFNKDGTPNPILGHSAPLAALGVLILFLGWFGFNPGSQLAADAGPIAHIATTTFLAGAAGGVAAALLTRLIFGKADYSMILNGILAGLVAITAPCAAVGPKSALIIGIVAGVLVVYSCMFFERKLKVDDAVGAISVHAVCGVWGTLAVGIFANEGAPAGIKGLLFGGGFTQLGIQIVGVASVFVWAFGSSLLVWSIIKAAMGLRVSEQVETGGLDLEEHGAPAYPDFVSAGFEAHQAAMRSQQGQVVQTTPATQPSPEGAR